MNDLLTLFKHLLTQAFTALAGASPTAVIWGSAPGSDADNAFSKLAEGWRLAIVDSVDEVEPTVQNALQDGPVLILPSWDSALYRPRSDGLSLFEDSIVRCRPVADKSLLCTVTPISMLTAERSSQFRRALDQNWQPILTVQSAGALVNGRPALEIAAMFLTTRAPAWRPLKMFKVNRRDEPETVRHQFERLLRQEGGQVRLGYVVREAIQPGVSLGFDRHHPDLLSRRTSISTFGPTVHLEELYEVRLGRMHSVHEQHWYLSQFVDGAVRVLRGRDIGRDGKITPPDEDSLWARVPNDRQLQVGDIVVRSIQHPTDRDGLIAAEVQSDHLPLAASQNVIVLHSRTTLDRHQRRVTLLLLRSVLGQSVVVALGRGGPHVSLRALASLPVPQPDDVLTASLDALEDAEARFGAWRTEAAELLATLFDDKTVTESRRRIVVSGRQLRLRAEAAALLDDLGHTVRTRFPLPIAYRWRIVEAKCSVEPSTDGYEAILDCFEVLLCYAASLALAMAYIAGIQVGAVDAIRSKLLNKRSGPALGDWTAVLDEVASGRRFQQVSELSVLPELRSLLNDPEVDLACRRLRDRRNNQAHLRRIDTIELPAALNEARRDLVLVVRRAMFLADLPLVAVARTRWNTYGPTTTVYFRELMGDHSIVPTQTMDVADEHMEEGSLYVLDGMRHPRLLRPFLIGRDCPKCRNWSTFVIDRVGDSGCILRSLEHGHTVEDGEVTGAFSAVGWLPLRE